MPGLFKRFISEIFSKQISSINTRPNNYLKPVSNRLNFATRQSKTNPLYFCFNGTNCSKGESFNIDVHGTRIDENIIQMGNYVFFDGPGCNGSWPRRIYEMFTGKGKTGIDENVYKALKLIDPETDIRLVGYSRGSVSVIKVARRLAEMFPKRNIYIDIRDPVEGALGSKSVKVPDNVVGIQQVSLDNRRPGFAPFLAEGKNITTIITNGGHNSRAGLNYDKSLPFTKGNEGKVLIETGDSFKLANPDHVNYLKLILRLNQRYDGNPEEYEPPLLATSHESRIQALMNSIKRCNLNQEIPQTDRDAVNQQLGKSDSLISNSPDVLTPKSIDSNFRDNPVGRRLK